MSVTGQPGYRQIEAPHRRRLNASHSDLRRENRIRAHVLLCWLALLVTRIAENAARDTWHNLVDAGKYGGGARSDDWRAS